MRVLFLVFHGFSEYSGITKKIRGQIDGLEANGAQVDLAYYDFDNIGNRYWVIGNNRVVSLGNGFMGKLRKRIDFKGLSHYITQQKYDLVYIRSYHNANPFTIGLVKKIKQSCNSKIVLEIPTYPYDLEYQGFGAKLELLVDKLFRKRLVKYVDKIVTFSEDEVIFGKETIQISNAIDFNAIPLRIESQRSLETEVHLLGVAEIHFWHGFDRAIKGLGEYYKSNHLVKVYFHIVGAYSGAREKEEIESVIDEYNLQDHVVMHGALFGEKLDDIFNRCDFAIGSLGRHRTGISRMRSLKNREYAARGISFLYAESDPDFDTKPYVIKCSPDESIVDICRILDYLKNKAISSEEIRKSVANLSWKNQMGYVLAQILN